MSGASICTSVRGVLLLLAAGVAMGTAAIGITARPAAGQVPTLPRIDTLVATGDYDAARAALDRWWSAQESSDVPGSDMARALMLRAKLQTDPAEAESDYLALVLGYPASSLAPEALLRLGQGLLATGEASRAAAYLHRLTADYPGRAERPAAFLWLARAHSATRQYAAACQAAKRGLADARDPRVAAMLRAEAGAACSVDGQAAGRVEGRVQGSVADQQPPATGLARATGEWAVQTGAFRQRASADALMERLRRAGYSPRLVRVPRNDLMRVRVGQFTTSDEASDLLTRLRDDGFDAVVVRDAHQERQP